jgi:hypothetical protein
MPDFEHKARLQDVHIESTTPGGGVWCIIAGRRICIPQSQIDDESECFKTGDHGELVISEWIALEKKLI